ncbi:2181_t:CDS:2 [Dentiscutata erythropus]|uniref:2181_t:CDS:1 n=1 Tax=Dentiscutata erythropus TaxID=1348616 RepID=A0A9N9H0J5_9GLOM|nr:2181_t:CDS:2 [Dentiscutata erythropus]
MEILLGRNLREKSFNFQIDDGNTFSKKFKPDIKLEDVRKKLAENRNDWNAEKLLFKKDGNRIYHENESDYTLNELRKSNNSIIYVENLLKKIKVYIDGKVCVLSLSLDPEDKLDDIRKIYIEKSEHAEVFTNDFKFREKNGMYVDEDQERFSNLKEILVNGNKLYISTLREGKIMIYSGHNKTPSKPFRYSLHKGKSLTEIREELENIWEERTQLYMCPDCYFIDQRKAQIFKFDENDLKLGEILSIENDEEILYICREHEHDLIKLTNKCGYGFIIKNGSVERANYRAFTIKETPKCHEFEDKYEEDLFECKNEFQELYKRNFITFGSTYVLPWVPIFLGANYSSLHKKLENYEKAVKYSYIKYRKVSIDIKKDKICVEKEFVDDVEKALSEGTQEEKIKNLKKIAEKYGYFYASSVYFGGVIVEKIEDMKYSSGDKSQKLPGWVDSLQDPGNWEVIEYHEIYSIFSLLENNLKRRVLNTLGKKILKAKVDPFMYFTSESKQRAHGICKQLNDIPNIKDCQIFSTILKRKKDKHIFSSCVAYDTPERPIIIVSRVPSKKKFVEKQKLKRRPIHIPIQIGWMVIGYPTETFDFELSNTIESEKYEVNDQDTISHTSNLNLLDKYVITTCVMDKVDASLQEEAGSASEISSTSNSNNTNQLNVRDFKLIVGSHFSLRMNSACLFAYCSKIRKKQMNEQDEPLLKHLKLFIW